MRIVFHGENAASFSHDFGRRVGETADIRILPDLLTSSAHREAYAAAEAIIGVRFARDLPQPESLRLFHVPGAVRAIPCRQYSRHFSRSPLMRPMDFAIQNRNGDRRQCGGCEQ